MGLCQIPGLTTSTSPRAMSPGMRRMVSAGRENSNCKSGSPRYPLAKGSEQSRPLRSRDHDHDTGGKGCYLLRHAPKEKSG